MAVAKADSRLVAVGQRGHIVVSSDGGKTWKQAPVPVSSDLTAVFFADRENGWAVGHDGVVLHSGNGGESWQVQLTGHKANDLLLAAMERKSAAEPASADAKALLAEAQRYKEQGADKPFLDVWFADAANGYVVGAYNLIFRTADGGKTWEPWFDRPDNPKFFNLYAIRPVAGDLYIAGEGGLVLKLDAAAQRFRALAVPYKGSFFGVAEAEKAVVVFGLRGNVYRSDDGGATWAKADAGLAAAVVSATRTAGGALLLADAGGRLASDHRWRALLPQGRAQAARAGHGPRRDRRRSPRARGAARRDRRGDDGALNRRPQQESRSWRPSPTRSTRCRSSASSRNSTGTRATGSSGWCSTTGCRWWSSASSSPCCSATWRRRSSC